MIRRAEDGKARAPRDMSRSSSSSSSSSDSSKAADKVRNSRKQVEIKGNVRANEGAMFQYVFEGDATKGRNGFSLTLRNVNNKN